MAEKAQPNRWRCLTAKCNPVMHGEEAASNHNDETGHRVAKWPVRSEAGKAEARKRNRSGYYDKYNVGAKSFLTRGDKIDPALHEALLGSDGDDDDDIDEWGYPYKGSWDDIHGDDYEPGERF